MVQIKQIIFRSPQKDLEPHSGKYSFHSPIYYHKYRFGTETQELKYTYSLNDSTETINVF